MALEVLQAGVGRAAVRTEPETYITGRDFYEMLNLILSKQNKK